jgi:hypothetical protein
MALDSSCGTAGVRKLVVEVTGDRRTIWTTAKLHGASFSLRLRRKLGAGTYTVTTYATDAAGRTEVPLSLDVAWLRIR